MDLTTVLLVIFVFTAWGFDAFFSKLAANRIASPSSLWYAVGFAPTIITYSLLRFGLRTLAQGNRLGIGLGFLAGALGAVGIIGFHILLSRSSASTIVPMTGLYPALTAVLAIIFLRESVSVTKVLGIALSLVAVYLLSS